MLFFFTAFVFLHSICVGQAQSTLTTTAVTFLHENQQLELQQVSADAYDEASLIKNVTLPGELGGAIPTDIIFLEEYSKFYVYGKRRLIVIDAINNTVTKSIEISANSQYEPVERNGANQAWHESHLVLVGNFVYCATEEFKILKINPVDDVIVETVVEKPTTLSLDNWYNNMKLKYDARTNLIYWVIAQFEGEYSTVLIYDANEFQLIHQLDIDKAISYGTIEDIAINETLDEFYVGCSKGVRRYNANNFQLVEVIDDNGEQKGDLLYINENGVHCLYSFPRIWGSADAHIFKIDFTTNTISSFVSPLSTETACFYNENTNEIYIGFDTPNTYENNVFVINPIDNSIEAGIATKMNSDPFWNFPVDFTSYNNKVIVSQRNEIVLINEDSYNVELVGNSVAEGNLYYKAAVSGNHALVTSPGGGNVKLINTSGVVENTLEVGATLYFGCFNPNKNKAYFYNKTLQGKSKVYIYNTLTDEVEILEMGNNISDMFVYSPDEATNRVYVSNFDDTRIVKAIDGETDMFTDPVDWIYLEEHYCNSMYLAPNNKLYCMVGMDNEGNNDASIEILDANNDFVRLASHYYTTIGGALDGEFCYNSFNGKVYAIAWDMNPAPAFGKLTEIDSETNVVTSFDISDKPTHLACSPVNNKVYIRHAASPNSITVFDCAEHSITSIFIDNPALDIEYDPARDLVFVLYNETDTYKLGFIDNEDFKPGMKLPTGSCSIAYNPGNSSIYTYIASNNTNAEQVEIWQCNLDYYINDIYSFSSIQIPLEGRHTFKYDGHLFNNDILFDEHLKQIYVVNGGHSNISVIGYDESEPLFLHPKTNWISIPRHTRPVNPEWTLVEDVFHRDNFSLGYDYLDLTHLNAEYNPELLYTAEWDFDWDFFPNDDDARRTFSTRGYKLTTLPDTYSQLTMSGTVEDPTTPIELYSGNENWVGYFLHKQQDIFDALGNTLRYLDWIEAENWFCWYAGPLRNPNDPITVTEGWLCSDKVHNISYGKMVILKAGYVEPGYTFTWQGSGRSIVDTPKAETEYYTYAETADYTPIVVSLDTAETISEIGVFVNDTCVGACTVLPGDTVVGIQAYMDGQSGDSLTFETYANTKSTAGERIRTYYVFNTEKKQYEQRGIQLGERKDFYQVSLKKPEQTLILGPSNLADIMVYPNPANRQLFLVYELDTENWVELEVYDLYGKKVVTLLQGLQLAGVQKYTWNLTQTSGQKLASGVYTIRLRIGTESVTRKVLIN